MAHSVFVDTNIVLDLLVEEREAHAEAIKLVAFFMENRIEIVISEDMLSTIYYISRDKNMALQFLQTIQRQWRIVPYGQKVIEESLQFALDNGSDLEDSLQCFAAIENGCRILLTSDQSFAACGNIELANYDNCRNILF